jgi:hypothetical protein
VSKDLTKNIKLFNRLWLKWDKINHLGDGTIELTNPTFYGPVLSDCLPMEETGGINLDLTSHFLVIIPKPYIVRLTWEDKISQDNNSAKFKKAILLDQSLGNLKLLKKDNKVLIDCEDHTTEARARGKLKPSFNAIVFDSNDQIYDITS